MHFSNVHKTRAIGGDYLWRRCDFYSNADSYHSLAWGADSSAGHRNWFEVRSGTDRDDSSRLSSGSGILILCRVVLNLRLTPKSASKRRYMRTNCPSRRSARPEVRALTHVCAWIGSCAVSGIYTRYSWTISNITTFSAFRHVLYLKKLKHIYALV